MPEERRRFPPAVESFSDAETLSDHPPNVVSLERPPAIPFDERGPDLPGGRRRDEPEPSRSRWDEAPAAPVDPTPGGFPAVPPAVPPPIPDDEPSSVPGGGMGELRVVPGVASLDLRSAARPEDDLPPLPDEADPTWSDDGPDGPQDWGPPANEEPSGWTPPADEEPPAFRTVERQFFSEGESLSQDDEDMPPLPRPERGPDEGPDDTVQSFDDDFGDNNAFSAWRGAREPEPDARPRLAVLGPDDDPDANIIPVDFVRPTPEAPPEPPPVEQWQAPGEGGWEDDPEPPWDPGFNAAEYDDDQPMRRAEPEVPPAIEDLEDDDPIDHRPRNNPYAVDVDGPMRRFLDDPEDLLPEAPPPVPSELEPEPDGEPSVAWDDPIRESVPEADPLAPLSFSEDVAGALGGRERPRLRDRPWVRWAAPAGFLLVLVGVSVPAYIWMERSAAEAEAEAAEVGPADVAPTAAPTAAPAAPTLVPAVGDEPPPPSGFDPASFGAPGSDPLALDLEALGGPQEPPPGAPGVTDPLPTAAAPPTSVDPALQAMGLVPGPASEPVPRLQMPQALAGTGEFTAPTAEAVPGSPLNGTVTISGDAAAVRLVGEDGSYGAGSVPPGLYTVVVQFTAGLSSRPATKVRLRGGEAVTIFCSSSFQRCRVD